jgi:outer membrane protein assembly factor BamD
VAAFIIAFKGMKHSILLSVFLLAGFLAGCGSTDTLRFDNPQDAYNRGRVEFERGRYQRAAEVFQQVFTFGRTHEWAADAQWYLAMSHYNQREFIIAGSEFSRFAQLYRGDPRVAEAEYMRAMTYYELSPPFQLDQTDSQRAVEAFQLYINRFPRHERVADAQEKIGELRDKMARKQFESGRLYERRLMWQAAALTYERAFDLYPDTRWADEALLGAMRAFVSFADESVRERQAERYQRVIDNYNRLVQIFPNSPHQEEARALREQAEARIRALGAVAAS